MPWFTKKRKKKASFGFSGHIQGDFGRFQHVSAVSNMFQPYRSTADKTWYGRYSPILAESDRFGVNWAKSARIREKKKNADADRRAGNCVGCRCGTSGVDFKWLCGDVVEDVVQVLFSIFLPQFLFPSFFFLSCLQVSVFFVSCGKHPVLSIIIKFSRFRNKLQSYKLSVMYIAISLGIYNFGTNFSKPISQYC